MRPNGSSETSVASNGANASSASASSDLRRRPDVLVAGLLDHANEQPVEREVLDAGRRQSDVPDVRRVESAAKHADHASSGWDVASGRVPSGSPGRTGRG